MKSRILNNNLIYSLALDTSFCQPLLQNRSEIEVGMGPNLVHQYPRFNRGADRESERTTTTKPKQRTAAESRNAQKKGRLYLLQERKKGLSCMYYLHAVRRSAPLHSLNTLFTYPEGQGKG